MTFGAISERRRTGLQTRVTRYVPLPSLIYSNATIMPRQRSFAPRIEEDLIATEMADNRQPDHDATRQRRGNATRDEDSSFFHRRPRTLGTV